MESKINIERLLALKESNPEFAEMIDLLQDNHKKTIDTISHELRNPLALVSSAMQLLQKNCPEVMDHKHWNTTLEELGYMSYLLADLTSTCVSSNLDFRPVNMHKFCKHIVNIFDISLVDRRAVEFTSSIPTDLPLILGNTVKLHEVFINILQNAVDSLHGRGMVHLSLSVEIIDEKDYVVAAVCDDGCGIPDNILPTIFDPYITSKVKGTGLGLSVSKAIIETHGGILTVSTSTTYGSTFLICLPVYKKC